MRESWTWTVEDSNRLVVRYVENWHTCSTSTSLVFRDEPDWESVAFAVEAVTNVFERYIETQDFTLTKVDILVTRNDCDSCGEELPVNECNMSERPCGHHCNHSMSHEHCDWCGTEWLGDGVMLLRDGTVKHDPLG